MKLRILLSGFVLLAVSVVVFLVLGADEKPFVRSVKLSILGPDGERFTGNYVADGRTNILTGVAPATISVRAADVSYLFQPVDQRQEFRVALYVDDATRTSFCSYKGGPVKGGWRCSNISDESW